MKQIRISLILSLLAIGGLLTACPAPGDGAASEGRVDDTAIEGDVLDDTTLDDTTLDETDPLDAPE